VKSMTENSGSTNADPKSVFVTHLRRSTKQHWKSWIICSAALITVFQVFLIVLASPERSLRSAYASCFRKDNVWYASIVAHGYVSTIPPEPQHKEVANVAFFPGFPLIARAVRIMFRLDVPVAIVLTAQIGAFVFWSYVLMWLRRWQFSITTSIVTVLLVLSHPDSFYLVIGYSESVFMVMLLGFLYWLEKPGWKAGVLTGLHGFGLTATRPVGVLCGLWPLMRSYVVRGDTSREDKIQKRLWLTAQTRALVLTVAGISGGILFFLFCWYKFGHWNLYMQTQRIGWGQQADYLAVFYPSAYDYSLPNPRDSISVGHFLISIHLLAFAVLIAIEGMFRHQLRPRQGSRIGFYICGLLMFYTSVSGTYESGMRAALRYDLCIHIVILLIAANVFWNCFQLRDGRLGRFLRYYILVLCLIISLTGLLIQFYYTQQFLIGIKIS
jgi:hypothetical protein